MKSSLKRSSIIHNQDGIAAVEFALISPIFIMMFVGMIDYAFYINAQMKLEATAVSAVNYVLQKGDDDDLEENVLYQSDLDISSSDENGYSWTKSMVYECANNVATTSDDDCGANDYKRTFYEFSIQKEHSPIFPYPGLSDNLTLVGEVRLQIDK